MAKLESYEYVSTNCNGNLHECDRIRQEIGKSLHELYKQSKIRGYSFRTIKSKSDLGEEYPLYDEEVEAINARANHKFPFLYGLVSYEPPMNPLVEEYILHTEKRFNLKRIRQSINGVFHPIEDLN